jgi:hypothetical protein
MRFKDRTEAGIKLADALSAYENEPGVVYPLPRGGVVLGIEIADRLRMPMDLIIPRKIGHPQNPEYAICAVAEMGDVVCNEWEGSGVLGEHAMPYPRRPANPGRFERPRERDLLRAREERLAAVLTRCELEVGQPLLRCPRGDLRAQAPGQGGQCGGAEFSKRALEAVRGELINAGKPSRLVRDDARQRR